MDSLPDHILRASFSMLPQVDVFRLRRVCWRFDDFLSDQFVAMALDELELLLQFRERKLEYVSADVPAQIVESYGPRFVKLEVTLLEMMRESFPNKIATSCPNLVELTLNQRQMFTFPWSSVYNFPMSSLLQMPNLKVLRANLTCPRLTIPMETVIDRLLDMDEIVHLQWHDHQLRAVRERGLPMAAVKGVTLPSWIASDMDVFPSVEAIKIHGVPKAPEILFFPSSLKKLGIFNMSIELTAAQLEPLKRLVCLTDFAVFDSSSFHSFDFLEYFTKLELLYVNDVKYFTADAFCFIPEAAPLRHVRLLNCPAVCESVFNILSSRKGLQHFGMRPIDSRDDEEFILQVVSSNVDTLREVKLDCCSGVTDSFLEQMCNRTILGLTILALQETSVTPNGVLQFLRRRHQLIQTAREQNDWTGKDGEPIVKRPRPKDATGLATPSSLMLIAVNSDIVRKLAAEDQLAQDAMVHLHNCYF